MVDLIQTIYSSRPFGFDSGALNGILLDARLRNKSGGVTGALLCRQDIYLQMLEGPKDVVESIFKSIAADNRHVEVKMRMSRDVSVRMFANWAMLHEAQPSIWSPAEIDNGALDRATADDFRAVFEDVAARALHKSPKTAIEQD